MLSVIELPNINERSKENNVRVDTVRLGAVQPVGDEDTPADREDVGVQVVVDQAQLLAWRERTCGAVDFAREGGVGGVVDVFPDLRR